MVSDLSFVISDTCAEISVKCGRCEQCEVTVEKESEREPRVTNAERAVRGQRCEL